MLGGQLVFDGVLAVGQPVHRGVDLVGGRVGDVEIGAQGGIGPPGGVDSLLAGRTTREMISASARSRARHGGPSSPGKPSWRAIAVTAATCPCGSDRAMLNSLPAGTSCAPFSPASIQSTTCSGNADRLATVSLRTRLPSR